MEESGFSKTVSALSCETPEGKGFIRLELNKLDENTLGYNIYMSLTSGKGYFRTNAKLVKDPVYEIFELDVKKKYYIIITEIRKANPLVEYKSKELSYYPIYMDEVRLKK
jgi:hypothetical protein